jgi:hypothetical protein
MNFDLNIQNYKLHELLDMFDLPTSFNGMDSNGIDSNEIEFKENKLRENIINNKSIDSEVRQKTIDFLREAKQILLTQMKPSLQLTDFANTIFNKNKQLKTSIVREENGSNMIIQQPSTGYSQSLPSEFYSGVINPLKKRILKQNLNIDTRFRDNYYGSVSSNYHLDLPIKFTNVVSMQLSAFEFPCTYYTISKSLGNHYFTVVLEESNSKYVIVIPDGNYTPTSLTNYLNNYVTTGPLSNVTQMNALLFTLNINTATQSGTGQMVVGINSTVNGGDLFKFTLDFQTNSDGFADSSAPLPLKLGWLLGFRNGIYSGNYSYVSEASVDLNGSRYIYLVVDDYNNNVNNSFYSAFNSSLLNKNILARLTTQSSYFNVISQNNLSLITTPRQYFGPVDIQKLRVQLLDEYGRIIDLHNMDYSFCLTFQSVYDL